MTKVVIDTSLRSRLHDLNEVLEVCDESGRTIGFFHPVLPPTDAGGIQCESPFSEEELRRRQEEPGGRLLKDILADLKDT